MFRFFFKSPSIQKKILPAHKRISAATAPSRTEMKTKVTPVGFTQFPCWMGRRGVSPKVFASFPLEKGSWEALHGKPTHTTCTDLRICVGSKKERRRGKKKICFEKVPRKTGSGRLSAHGGGRWSRAGSPPGLTPGSGGKQRQPLAHPLRPCPPSASPPETRRGWASESANH